MKKIVLFIVIISFIVISGCNKSDNPVTPSTKGNISGTITDQATGAAIAGASISTQPATSTVQTGNDGNYSIPDVEAGDYTLTITNVGYFPNTSNITVSANQTSTKNISLSVIPADPVASFSYGGTTVTPAAITFQNASENATNYSWDFGDGTTSTEANPAKSYSQKGTYTVTLTASNNVTGKTDQMSKIIAITPGKVYLQKVIVDQIPFSDANGSGWDFGSGPDLYFSVTDSVSSVIYEASTYFADLAPASLPVLWNLSPEYQFQNWNKTYYINLWDYDPLDADDYIGYANGFRISQEVNSNYPTTVSLQNTSGTIKVRIILRWE